MDNALLDFRRAAALQQPDWEDPAAVRRVRDDLARSPGLVTGEEVHDLRSVLALVATGAAHVVQAGDCAEDPVECEAGYVARKAALLDVLAGTMKMITSRPVVRVGRIGGQFAKPRSKPTEVVGGVELPAYRGHMVNSPEPDPEGRRPDPRRMLVGYSAAGAVMRHLGWGGRRQRGPIDPVVWTSHEALLLDYETSLVRRDDRGEPVLTSTHFPWIGERTRQVDGPHVDLLARVANPVACKVGPTTTADEVLALCERLDPHREPGRLTLISRMGADAVADLLPPLVAAVRAAGHPVIWLCDPMHANTVVTPEGLKTRYLSVLNREVAAFRAAVEEAGGIAGGLHLEATPDQVTECVHGESDVDRVGEKYTSFCDPRLNPDQAVAMIHAWGDRAGARR